MGRLYAATGYGIARLDESGDAWTVELFLEGTRAQCLAVDPGDAETVYAGLREGGVRRSTDAGRSWTDCALPEPGVFSLAVSAADGAVYAGTEPSRLFRSDDRGASWRELEALLDLPSRSSWSFPPRPWTSHVRWIAPSPHDAKLLLVRIELGGLKAAVSEVTSRAGVASVPPGSPGDWLDRRRHVRGGQALSPPAPLRSLPRFETATA